MSQDPQDREPSATGTASVSPEATRPTDRAPTGGGWRKLSRGLVHPIMKWRADRIARKLAPLLSPGESVLDVGTGDGVVAREIARLSSARITGIDTVEYGDIGYPYIRYDGHRMPVGDSSFETVMALLSLHHSSDAESIVRECHRVASKRLLIVEEVFKNRAEELFTKYEDWLANRLLSGEVEVTMQFHSLEEWRGIFDRVGLKVESEQRFFPVPFIPLRTVLFVLRK